MLRTNLKQHKLLLINIKNTLKIEYECILAKRKV